MSPAWRNWAGKPRPAWKTASGWPIRTSFCATPERHARQTVSQLELHKHKLRNVLDDQHDPAPKARCVDHASALVDGCGNVFGHLLGLGPQGALLQMRRHGRAHKA